MHLRKQRDAALRAYASLRFGFENQDDTEVDKLMTESKVIAAIDEVMKKASLRYRLYDVRGLFLNSLYSSVPNVTLYDVRNNSNKHGPAHSRHRQQQQAQR